MVGDGLGVHCPMDLLSEGLRVGLVIVGLGVQLCHHVQVTVPLWVPGVLPANQLSLSPHKILAVEDA